MSGTYVGDGKSRTGTEKVERRTVGADELAGSRLELSFADSGDGSGELGFEPRSVVRRECRRNDVLRPLEELVDDLGFVRAVAKTGECVHESLYAVLVVDDRRRVRTLERVRLVVDDDGPVAVAPEDIEAPMQQDAVLLERERTLGASTWKGCDAAGKLRRAIRVDEAGDPVELCIRRSRIPLAYRGLELAPRRGTGIVERDELQQPMDGISDLRRCESLLLLARGTSTGSRRKSENTFGEVPVRTALVQSKRAVGETPHIVEQRRRDFRQRGELDADVRGA
jgi:hypothetical protein